MALPIIGGIIAAVGGLFKGFFGWKEAQANTVITALNVVKGIDDNDAQSTAALANALQVILSQGSWLEKNWRSWLMIICMAVLVSSWFGYTPPNFDDEFTPMMQKMFELLQIGLGGYIVRRGIVDIVRIINIRSILTALISKKVL